MDSDTSNSRPSRSHSDPIRIAGGEFLSVRQRYRHCENSGISAKPPAILLYRYEPSEMSRNGVRGLFNRILQRVARLRTHVSR